MHDHIIFALKCVSAWLVIETVLLVVRFVIGFYMGGLQ